LQGLSGSILMTRFTVSAWLSLIKINLQCAQQTNHSHLDGSQTVLVLAEDS
jgi:hypothetical protein